MQLSFKTCPSCGSRKIKLVAGDYSTTAHGRPIVVPDVQRHECPVCGEVLLDYDAVQQIQAARQNRRTSAKPSLSRHTLKHGT